MDKHALNRPDSIDEITDHLTRRVDASPSREALRTRVRRHFAAMKGAPIREFVPLFVERRVRAELRHAT